VQQIVDLFNQAGLETQASDQMEDLIWEKLLVNTGINAITALTGIRNGFIAESPEGRDVCRAAVEEGIQVARARGRSPRTDMVDRVLAVCRATAVNRSSMGQDVDRGKRTEIQSINGAIVRFAEEAGIAAPVNRTLTQLVRLMEDNYSKT
jgi:2-dehydropantoate 2-reductase